MFSDFNLLDQLSDITGLDQKELYQVIIGPFIFFMAGLFTNLVSVKLNQISKRRFLRLSIKAWLNNYKDKLEKQIHAMDQIILMLDGSDNIKEQSIPRIQSNVIENYSDEELRRVFEVTTFFGLVIHKKNMRSYMTIKQGLNDVIHINNDVTDMINIYKKNSNINLNVKKELYNRSLNLLLHLKGEFPIQRWSEFNRFIKEHFNNHIFNKTKEIALLRTKDYFEKIIKPVREEIEKVISNLHPSEFVQNVQITQFIGLNNDYVSLLDDLSKTDKELKSFLEDQNQYLKLINIQISDYLNEPDVITNVQPDYVYRVPFTSYEILSKKVAIARVGKNKLKRVSFKVLGNKYIFVLNKVKS